MTVYCQSAHIVLRYHNHMDHLTTTLPAPAIDGPWRVDTFGARLVIGRQRGGFEEIRLSEIKSMGIYGQSSDSSLLEVLRHSRRWVLKQPDSISGVELVAGSGRDEILHVIRGLISYGDSYLQKLRENGLTWSPNGRYLLAVLWVSGSDLEDQEIRMALERLIELSVLTNLRPMILTDTPKRLGSIIQAELNWQLFLGPDQVAYFRDRYAVDPAPGMPTRVPAGVTLEREPRTARIFNGLNYEPTQNALDRKHAIASDIENYQRFLEGLTDGS